MNKRVEIANTKANRPSPGGGAYLIDDKTRAFDRSAIMKALSDTVPWERGARCGFFKLRTWPRRFQLPCFCCNACCT